MGKNKGKIKAAPPQQGSLIKSQQPPNYDQQPPVFSLEKVQNGDYCFSVLDQEHKAMFAESIFRRKTLNWADIKRQHKHGLGFEKIPKHQIKVAMPRFITEEVDNLLAFRYHGKRAMVGYRVRNVFYVLWFDHNFSLYPH